VSPPAAVERESHRRRVSPASRVIPGARPAAGLPRKKPQSAILDERYWAEEDRQRLGPRIRKGALEALAEAVLPMPSIAEQRPRLAAAVAVDFLAVLTSFMAAVHVPALLEFAIRHDAAAWLRSSFFPVCCLGPLLLQAVVLTLLGYSEGLYRPDLRRSGHEERVILAKVVAWSTLLLGAAILLGIDEMSLGTLITTAPLNYLAMLGGREWRRRTKMDAQTKNVRNVLIVGAGKLAREAAAHLAQHRELGRAVRGFLTEGGPVGGDVLGTVEDLARVARAEFVDEVLLAIPEDRDLTRRVIREARRSRLDVKIVPDLFGFKAQSEVLESLGSIPVVTLYQEPIPAFGLFLKRAVDAVGAATGLVISTPLLAAIALLIKLDSKEPVLYRAARVGRKGQEFLCCKFRTMVTDADKLKPQLRACNEREGPFFKMADDPRITRVGRFLRRYSLDELPQLWNVLTGEMSLVGPAPTSTGRFRALRPRRPAAAGCNPRHYRLVAGHRAA